MSKRVRFFIATAAAVVLVGVGIWWVDSPRRELVSRATGAPAMIVDWYEPVDGEAKLRAYRLTGNLADQFAQTLSHDVAIDHFYFPIHAVATDNVGMSVLDADERLVELYAIYRDAGPTECVSLAELRTIAEQGEPIEESQLEEIITDDVRSKSPHAWGSRFVLPLADRR